ncbi:hypothetical protein AVEN_129383-1 [Araneus ventricosus]|uniref:Uncharacterized protein n=1 Tax=Araneus ventricosus TaxID=182803 RepID=A0A4Y2N5D4_ARAVE|nr:hypothetical protein AVEN_129383-1 [Araneus ventricosus]
MKIVGLPPIGLEISVLSLSLSSPKNDDPLLVFCPLPKSLSFLLTLISLPLEERSKSLSTNPRQFCMWSLFQPAIIVSLLLVLSCHSRVLRLELNDPINHFHERVVLVTGWTARLSL